MSDLVRVDSDYKVFWLGEEIGVLSTPIKTDWRYDGYPRGVYFTEQYLREMEISFRVVEPPPPPKPKRRTRTEALGLRRPQ